MSESDDRVQLRQPKNYPDHVVNIHLNRPERMNAMSLGMLSELGGILDEVHERVPRAVIITAADPGFCSGADLAESLNGTPELALERVRTMHRVLALLRSVPCPVIAAVDGVALGLGCELLLAADIRVATGRSSFGYPETRVAVPSPSRQLIEVVGLGRAQDLLLTARTIGIDEAAAWGLVSSVHEDSGTEAIRIAGLVAGLAPNSVRETKKNILLCLSGDNAAAVENHIDGVFAAAKTIDRQEGLAAFVEKRNPHFTDQ